MNAQRHRIEHLLALLSARANDVTLTAKEREEATRAAEWAREGMAWVAAVEDAAAMGDDAAVARLIELDEQRSTTD